MNYVSFSLWGNQPIYTVGAIRNSELIKTIYPGWKMVLYYNNSVPEDTITDLTKNDVMLIDMTDSDMYGMFWRFLAVDIDDAEYVSFRDCDSRLSFREKLAVDEWIISEKSLHIMRDHPAHRVPYGNNGLGILGGMWGIKSDRINMKKTINEYPHYTKHIYGQDQNFLTFIYDYFGTDKKTHDEFFEKIPFPIKRKNGRFIGERINIHEGPLTNDHLILLIKYNRYYIWINEFRQRLKCRKNGIKVLN
jgi:hypothetical protein